MAETLGNGANARYRNDTSLKIKELWTKVGKKLNRDEENCRRALKEAR